MDRGKACFLESKWTHEKVDKASDESINKTHAEYKQHELNKKGEKTWKVLFKHVINLYSTEVSQWIKIKDSKKLCQDIETDPIIKDQMAGLGCLFVRTFGNYLALVLIATHTANNLDFGDEPENEVTKLIKKNCLFVRCDHHHFITWPQWYK